ncbi:MAG: hypothetical protein Q9209_007380 [Squamulea sp. 1 TL-2023]
MSQSKTSDSDSASALLHENITLSKEEDEQVQRDAQQALEETLASFHQTDLDFHNMNQTRKIPIFEIQDGKASLNEGFHETVISKEERGLLYENILGSIRHKEIAKKKEEAAAFDGKGAGNGMG